MVKSETAEVLIPKDFRFWFGGARKLEMGVYDIDEIFPGTFMGTVKKMDVPFWGRRTFAVRKDDQGRWYISA